MSYHTWIQLRFNQLDYFYNNSPAIEKFNHSNKKENYKEDFIEFSEYLRKKINIKDNMIIDADHRELHTPNMPYYIQFLRVNYKIPIALNGCYLYSTKKSTSRIYVCIIPYKTSTIIITAHPKNTPEKLIAKLYLGEKSNIEILEFIESCIASSDDWFMQEDTFNDITKIKKDILIDDIKFFTEREVFGKYDMSIFDKIKKAHATEHHTDKITHIPTRKSKPERETNMLMTISKSKQLINQIKSNKNQLFHTNSR